MESSFFFYADMAELADALDSGSNECKFVQVRPLLSAPYSINPNLIDTVEFGFFITDNGGKNKLW